MGGFRVIPVIDVKGGVAVHAKAGRRESYQPIKSWLTVKPDPVGLAQALEATYGFRELYLADLDAIEGVAPLNLNLLSETASLTSLQLMVDGGFRSLREAEEALKAGASKVIFATETLPSLKILEQAVKAYGERVVASVDTFGGKLLASSPELASLPMPELLKKLGEVGVSSLLILDLERVGAKSGVNLPLIQLALKLFDGEILVGGGVRSLKDLEELAELGVSGALVATAIHERRIRPEELFDKGYTGWRR
ncbi:MAG: HisA/HisF-related TIM barrel protein [Candidatus Hecatellaceae archaeon]